MPAQDKNPNIRNISLGISTISPIVSLTVTRIVGECCVMRSEVAPSSCSWNRLYECYDEL